MAQVTQISTARTYHLTAGSWATYHNIILTLNRAQSYSSVYHVRLSWALHLLNWESIKCHLISLICSIQFIFTQEIKTAAWSYHSASSISAVYKHGINTAALMCLEQYFPKIHVYFQWPSLVLQLKKRLKFYWCRIAIPKQCDDILFFNKLGYQSKKMMFEELKIKLLCKGFWVLIFWKTALSICFDMLEYIMW